MPINLPSPIELPPIPAATADILWLSSLTITAPDPSLCVRVEATLIPMVSSTGQLFKDKQETLLIGDLFTAAVQSPSLANTVNVLMTELTAQCISQSLFQ